MGFSTPSSLFSGRPIPRFSSPSRRADRWIRAKNPALADHLIRLALQRRYGEVPFPRLDDGLEAQAREVALHLHR